MNAHRQAEIHEWLGRTLTGRAYRLTTASADASFRRYLRVHLDSETLIVMDAPPEHEDCRPFVDLAHTFSARGVRVPAVLAADLDRGLLLLEDFGDRHYLAAAEASPAALPGLYGQAIDALVDLQRATAGIPLPRYDRALLEAEMDLFGDWFLGRLLEFELTDDDREILVGSQAALVSSALEQPRVTVHRDYHSRNLMVLPDGGLGMLDFQDAVEGPLSYDLVSLLRDCYIRLPEAVVRDGLHRFRRQAIEAGLLASDIDEATFVRWFDWMGMQRHFKAIGIFARLNERDGKAGYLGDIPRTLSYLIEVSARYEAFSALDGLLRKIEAAALPLLR